MVEIARQRPLDPATEPIRERAVAPVGVIINPRSYHNRRHGVRRPAHVTIAVPETQDELADALARFARAKVETVVIDGGDGTVRDVLTALPAAFGTSLPALALVPAGKTNVIARDVGALPLKDGVRRLCAALSGARPLRTTLRPALQVTWPDMPERRLWGMLFGAAAFSRSTTLANESLHPRGINHGTAVVLAMASLVMRTVFGTERGHLVAGEPMAIGIDGTPPTEGPRFLVMATALERLVLGLWPFADTGQGTLHWLDVAAPPHRLLGLIAHAARGRTPPWLTAAGHASGRAKEITIRLDRAFVLDGDLFEPGTAGVRLSATPSIRFLSA